MVRKCLELMVEEKEDDLVLADFISGKFVWYALTLNRRLVQLFLRLVNLMPT